jgi:hypothetical protein
MLRVANSIAAEGNRNNATQRTLNNDKKRQGRRYMLV